MAWGENGAENGLDPKHAARTKLLESKIVPCLNALYPGVFRAHCSKCFTDASVGIFSRHRAVLCICYDESAEKEVLVKLSPEIGDAMSRSLAMKRFVPGQAFMVVNDEFEPLEDILDQGDVTIQDIDDVRGNIVKRLVDKDTVDPEDGKKLFLLRGERPVPYLVIYHDLNKPSDRDVLAYVSGYSEEYLEGLDAEYTEKLGTKSGVL